jgi:hypothetical protein
MSRTRIVPQSDGKRIRVRGKWHLLPEEATARLSCGHNELRRWRGFCPWLGRKIGHLKVDGVYHYGESDVELVERARQAAVPGRSPRQDAEPWPSTRELVERGFSASLLKRRRLKGQVRTRRGHRVRPDYTLAPVREWCPQDLEKIRTRAQAKEAGRRPGYVTDKEAAAAPFGIPATTLARWRNPRGSGCPYLGRLLDAYQDKPSCIWYNSAADLRKATEKTPLGSLDPHRDEDGTTWLPQRLTGLIEQTLNNLRKRDNRAAAKLGRPRRAPSVRSKVIDRPHPKIRNGKLRVWHEGDLLAYKAWRNGTPHANGPGHHGSDSDSIRPQAAKKRRGRPTGTIDKGRVERARMMLEAWDRGEFKGNKARAGRAYQFDRSDATKIINAHERRKGRRACRY